MANKEHDVDAGCTSRWSLSFTRSCPSSPISRRNTIFSRPVTPLARPATAFSRPITTLFRQTTSSFRQSTLFGDDLATPSSRPLTPFGDGPATPSSRPLTPLREDPATPSSRPLTPFGDDPPTVTPQRTSSLRIVRQPLPVLRRTQSAPTESSRKGAQARITKQERASEKARFLLAAAELDMEFDSEDESEIDDTWDFKCIGLDHHAMAPEEWIGMPYNRDET
ncbi:hypothetical protein BZA05DRAFT_447882 [Tricharina praecox]|uniref:uncharacterized protein n=1 Tax=Tricharina praecox TaxID=43433 RepID=UPI00221FCAAF|nr:uncharacterized protein BZA05DRAFT_447882 [Tricharina praecox]KAI5845548.1 hypothetical protein BZA05DRAFT_447882 [Tricharina praecox]